jgi:hypothetical protein
VVVLVFDQPKFGRGETHDGEASAPAPVPAGAGDGESLEHRTEIHLHRPQGGSIVTRSPGHVLVSHFAVLPKIDLCSRDERLHADGNGAQLLPAQGIEVFLNKPDRELQGGRRVA